jgi:hypothetical protein
MNTRGRPPKAVESNSSNNKNINNNNSTSSSSLDLNLALTKISTAVSSLTERRKIFIQYNKILK